MVSLTAVEMAIAKCFSEDIEFLAVTLPDEKKGEKIVLLFSGDVTEETVKKTIKSSELNPLMQPRHYQKIDALPKLGSGKIDMNKAKEIVTTITDCLD